MARFSAVNKLIFFYIYFQPARHSKLEKADILEMAVKHLQNVQKQQLAMAMASDPTVLQKFKTGFNECSDEVLNYVNQVDPENSLKQRIKTHLNKCINGLEQMAQFNLSGLTYPFLSNTSAFFGGSPTKTNEISSSVGDQNNNPRIQIPQGLQLIPSRLPTGEFAFLVPNSSNLPCFSALASSSKQASSTSQDIGIQTNSRPSAFATVIPSSNNKLLSPPLSPTHSNSNDDLVVVNGSVPRTPSPHGFRPVNSNRNVFIPASNKIEQVHNITSTIHPETISSPNYQSEVKTIRYPIHNNEKKISSPKKIIEPLCIITNQSERFKQAQIIDETSRFEENLQQGVKRKFNDGLLTVASHEHNYRSKFVKLSRDTKEESFRVEKYAPTKYRAEEQFGNESETNGNVSEGASTSKDHCESSNDMWRPW